MTLRLLNLVTLDNFTQSISLSIASWEKAKTQGDGSLVLDTDK